MDLDVVIAQAKKEMNDAEDALLRGGFHPEHWTLVKQYILNAILHNQALEFKTVEGLASSSTDSNASEEPAS